MLNKVHVTTHAPLATSDNMLLLCPVPSSSLLTVGVRVENAVTSEMSPVAHTILLVSVDLPSHCKVGTHSGTWN